MGSDGLSKASGANTTADSMPKRNYVTNAKQSRRLQKASSLGAGPETHVSNPIDDAMKVRLEAQTEDVLGGVVGQQSIRRKAGSGTRVE